MKEFPKHQKQGQQKGAAAFGRRPAPFVFVGVGILGILA